jgi:hypothetical protein
MASFPKRQFFLTLLKSHADLPTVKCFQDGLFEELRQARGLFSSFGLAPAAQCFIEDQTGVAEAIPMKRSIVVLFFPCAIAQAGQFNTHCQYSHTLPDDSIVHYAKPGEAMVHDFVGNTKTDAFSSFVTLMQNKVTTCNTAPDFSAYWVPQLKRASGIVPVSDIKIYYSNKYADQGHLVQPFPDGFQMLAGDHMSTQPKAEISYNCSGKGISKTVPTSCSMITDASGTYAHLEVIIHFPTCWDGKNEKPDFRAKIIHTAYSNTDGSCPATHPIRVPKLEMHVQYRLEPDGDLSTAQLSMDPKLVNGEWVPQWGSLYTEHADFVNGWKTDAMKYAVDKCLNNDAACDNQIPVYSTTDMADGWISSGGATTTSGPVLRLGPGDTVFMKFPTPANVSEFPWTLIWLQTYGRNVTDSTQAMVKVYAATPRWDAAGPAPQPVDCSPVSLMSFGINGEEKPRLANISAHVKGAMSAGNPTVGICLRNTGDKTVELSSKDGKFAPVLFLK